MNVLILGGTGAMGVPLVKLLSQSNHSVTVTSRRIRANENNIVYIQGDAHKIEFLKSLFVNNYDVIIDFMVYSTVQFKERAEFLLNNCKQYIFFSSSRVYADSYEPITERSARLLDSCNDKKYLETDDYALSKAREEDILTHSGKSNYTIIRPYITYNNKRFQLGVYEKENWLWRVLHGRTIVIPKDILSKKTTFTYGDDVAKAVYHLIGNDKAIGEIFHIVNNAEITWNDVLNVYIRILENQYGVKCKVLVQESPSQLMRVWGEPQIKYDRLYNRTFSMNKLNGLCGEINFTDYETGIEKCLKEFMNNPDWLALNIPLEAWADKQNNEMTPLWQIKGFKEEVRYVKYRFLKNNNYE